MFWLLVFGAVALGAVYYRWSRRKLYRLAKAFPGGLKEYPIVGHGYLFLGSNEDRINSIHKMGRDANEHGGLIRFWLTHRLYVCMTDPEAISIVAKLCLDKDVFTIKQLRTVTGNGSIFAPVNIWHRRRRIMAPFFSLKNLNRLVPLFHEKSILMTDLMRTEVGGGDFPIWKYMTTYTFDTVGETAIGLNVNSQDHPDHFILRAIDGLLQIVAQRGLQPWLYSDFVFKKLAISKQFELYKQQLNDFVYKVIKGKRIRYEENETQRADNNNDNSGVTNFLDMIIKSSGGHENGYSDEELREEIVVMIVAGNDTSAVGASFVSVMLSRYPDIQDKVYQELYEVFGDSDRAVTPEDLLKLKYLEIVIKETIRLYPPVPLLARELHKDLQLPCGKTLVAGSSVAIHVWGTHRNPVYWGEDAEVFRPERFLEGQLHHPAQFIPFSYSVRNCIGGTYAMMSMKTGLANLLRRYKLLPPANMAAEDLTKPLRVKYDIMMKAVDNFVVRVEERK